MGGRYSDPLLIIWPTHRNPLVQVQPDNGDFERTFDRHARIRGNSCVIFVTTIFVAIGSGSSLGRCTISFGHEALNLVSQARNCVILTLHKPLTTLMGVYRLSRVGITLWCDTQTRFDRCSCPIQWGIQVVQVDKIVYRHVFTGVIVLLILDHV